VAAVANAGNNVVVTILGSGASLSQTVNNDINTPALSVGSVTVLQAPFPKTFTLDLATNNKSLTLNKGYKLQDIIIDSKLALPGGTAVKITHPTAGLASVNVKCATTAATVPVICVEVVGAGSHILEDVSVDVTDTNGNNIGIKSAATANLSIIGGGVRPTGNSTGITLIDSGGVLTVKGLTVDMANASHAQPSTGIVLRAPTSSVTGSTIVVSNNGSATGINVQATASKSTVEGNTFIASGSGIGVDGNDNLFSSALPINNFLGTFTNPVLPP
jgi:hypothetical protein